MAVAYFLEFPQATQQQVQQVNDAVNQALGNQPPQGAIFHSEGPTDEGGWWAFDVYDSEGSAQSFFDSILRPTLEAAGSQLPQPRKLDVYWQSNEAMSSS